MSAVAAPIPRRGLGKIGNVLAAGTALFSDGYANGVVGAVNVFLSKAHPVEFSAGNRKRVFSSMAFAGTVFGQLSFGYLVDRTGRKAGMLIATAIVFIFSALSAGAYYHGNVVQMFQILSAWRFFLGVGIGAEYPSSSVACAENTEDPSIKKSQQHMLFALATNSAIDWGFVVSSFVPLVVYWAVNADGSTNWDTMWRVSLAIGCIPAAIVFLFRLKMHEPELYRKGKITKNIPYWIMLKQFWRPFIGIALVWFIYDFIAYPFGIYSDTVTGVILGDDAGLPANLGWGVIINLFYIPGTMLGALLIDRVKPVRLMIAMLIVQAIIGFIMSGAYSKLSEPDHIAAFAVVYGLFLSFGEAGPGNCIGLLASKSFPTFARGQMYGLAAAIGKIGAFAGTWAFPALISDLTPADDPNSTRGITGPFYLGSGLAVLAAIITFLLIREVPADHMHKIEEEFIERLAASGYDVSQIGIKAQGESKIARLIAPEARDSDATSSNDEKIVDEEKAAI